MKPRLTAFAAALVLLAGCNKAVCHRDLPVVKMEPAADLLDEDVATITHLLNSNCEARQWKYKYILGIVERDTIWLYDIR